jgi:hypothetical protein
MSLTSMVSAGCVVRLGVVASPFKLTLSNLGLVEQGLHVCSRLASVLRQCAKTTLSPVRVCVVNSVEHALLEVGVKIRASTVDLMGGLNASQSRMLFPMSFTA